VILWYNCGNFGGVGLVKINENIKNLAISLTFTASTIAFTLVYNASFGDNTLLNNDAVELNYESIEEIDEFTDASFDASDEMMSISEYDVLHGYDIKPIIINDNNVEEDEYSGMNVSHEYEDYIKELCSKYADIYNLEYEDLYKAVMTIGDQESNGTWNNDGIVSPTEDYGVFQINIANHESIEEEFGYTTEDLLNDPYKNAEAAIWIISRNMASKFCETEEDIYGMYNGWITWSEKDECIKYVDDCLSRADEYFGNTKVLANR